MAKRSKVGKFFTPKTVISGIVILIAIAAAIGANVIVPYDPNEVDPRSCFLPTSSQHEGQPLHREYLQQNSL